MPPRSEWRGVTVKVVVTVILGFLGYEGASLATWKQDVDNAHSNFRLELAMIANSLCRIEKQLDHQPVSNCRDLPRR